MASKTTPTKTRKRAPGGGRPKSSPLRQHLANMPMAQRSAPPDVPGVVAPLAGEPPEGLGSYGKFLWQLLVDQQAVCAEKGITPSVGMTSYALAEQYCSAFDRWAEVKQTIAHIEAEKTERERHLAKWRVDDKGEWHLHGVWKAELKFRKSAVESARALGIGSQHPTTALQVNINNQNVEADSALALCGPYRKSARTVEAVAEVSDD